MVACRGRMIDQIHRGHAMVVMVLIGAYCRDLVVVVVVGIVVWVVGVCSGGRVQIGSHLVGCTHLVQATHCRGGRVRVVVLVRMVRVLLVVMVMVLARAARGWTHQRRPRMMVMMVRVGVICGTR